MGNVPTEYYCEIVEVNNQGRESGGFTDHHIAKTMDDAVAWLEGYRDGGADGRYFRYRITEVEVVA